MITHLESKVKEKNVFVCVFLPFFKFFGEKVRFLGENASDG